MWDKYNTKQEITSENLFVLFLYFNPTNNSDAAGNDWVFIAEFGEAMHSLLLAILATYSCNTVWWKKVDLHHDGGDT